MLELKGNGKDASHVNLNQCEDRKICIKKGTNSNTSSCNTNSNTSSNSCNNYNVKKNILFVSAEVAPYAKVGGLADVAGSLPKSLAAMGHDVRVIMPCYGTIKTKMDYVTDFAVKLGEKTEPCIIRKVEAGFDNEGITCSYPVYFVDSYHYFKREGIYCFLDDGERYAFFCRSILDMLPEIGFRPDVIHLNDWHCGPVAMLLEEEYKKNEFYSGISTLFTIHNLEYQGNFNKDVYDLFNPQYDAFKPSKAEFYGMFSFMKAGIVYSDIISTVSDTYSKEIQTPQFGEKLDGVLRDRKDDLFGIVNGIGYEEFNPETDKHIYKNYNSQSFEEGKKLNKRELQKEAGLDAEDLPLFGIVTRLAGQKGIALIMEAFDHFMSENIQFIALGSGDPYFESFLMEMSEKFKGRVSANIGFNAALAQKIYAACDFFLMPSRFEPCGLGQLISLRYGTIPIVRKTGGLADTVRDCSLNKENGNGFMFEEYNAPALISAFDRALEFFSSSLWNSVVKSAMEEDYSWNKPSLEYIGLYNRAISK